MASWYKHTTAWVSWFIVEYTRFYFVTIPEPQILSKFISNNCFPKMLSFQANFGNFLYQNDEILPIFTQVLENFEKYDPYQFLQLKRGHRYTRWLILRSISGACPRITTTGWVTWSKHNDNQSVNQLISHPIYQSINQSINHPIDQSSFHSNL